MMIHWSTRVFLPFIRDTDFENELVLEMLRMEKLVILQGVWG